VRKRVGNRVEDIVGFRVGYRVGDCVGCLVGNCVGYNVGDFVGYRVGDRVGNGVGCVVGSLVGDRVGTGGISGKVVPCLTHIDIRSKSSKEGSCVDHKRALYSRRWSTLPMMAMDDVAGSQDENVVMDEDMYAMKAIFNPFLMTFSPYSTSITS